MGNTYILDNDFSRVYKVDTTGHLTVYAGNGSVGFSGEAGLATAAAMFEPSGMCIDSANNLYIADSDNAIVREIPATNQTFPFAMTAGHIYTVAGQQETNYTYGGDGLLATTTGAAGVHLHFPDGCSVDSHGNLFIADRGNNAIRVVIGFSNMPPVGLAGPTVAGHIYLYTGATPVGSLPPAPASARTAHQRSVRPSTVLSTCSSIPATTSSSPIWGILARLQTTSSAKFRQQPKLSRSR